MSGAYPEKDRARHRRLFSRHAHSVGVVPARHTYRLLILMALGSLVLADMKFLGPERVDDVIPTWAILVWSALVVLGSVFTFASMWVGDKVLGMLIERTGYTAISTVCLAYGAATMLVVVREHEATFFLIGTGLAAAVRAWFVHRELRTLRKFMAEVVTTQEASVV